MSKFSKRVLSPIKFGINNLFYREYRFKRVVRRHLSQSYSPTESRATNTQKMIVYMADGKYRHGGLADRLRGVITIFKYCKDRGIDFRIYFTSPFNLEDYLVPNLYDWRVMKTQLSYHSIDSQAIYLYASRDVGKREMKFQRKITHKFLSSPHKQLHVYTTFYYEEQNFGELFRELFKPAPAIQIEIDKQLALLGDNYISISTRFLELLGDFKEPKSDASGHLSKEEQQDLIEKCINKIIQLKDKHSECRRILITSDSSRFLEQAAQLPFVYIIPGVISHIDNTLDSNEHVKTFVDFLTIAHAKKIYLLVTGSMYQSNFSKRASQIFDRPFEQICF